MTSAGRNGRQATISRDARPVTGLALKNVSANVGTAIGLPATRL